VAAIAGKGQEIDLLAIRDRTVLSQIWEFGSSHCKHSSNEKENENEIEIEIERKEAENAGGWEEKGKRSRGSLPTLTLTPSQNPSFPIPNHLYILSLIIINSIIYITTLLLLFTNWHKPPLF